jgi:hypothetical protein
MIQAGVAEDSLRIKAMQRVFEERTRVTPPRSVSDLIGLVVSLAWSIAPKDAQVLALKETSLEMYLGLVPPEELSNYNFVQIFRDPRDNWAAIRAGLSRYEALGDSERKSMDSLLLRVYLGWVASKGPIRDSLKSYTPLRFEDIVENPRQQLNTVARVLARPELAIEPFTLVTEGSPHVGNGYEDAFLGHPNPKNVGRWFERIPARDARLISSVLKPMMLEFGYDAGIDNALEWECVFSQWYAELSQDYLFSDPFRDADAQS